MKLKYLTHMQSGNSITSESIDTKGEYPVYGGGVLRGYTDNYTHDGGYILIGRQGANCGSVKEVKGKFFASEHAVVVTPNKKVDNGWLYYLLESMNLNQYSISAAQPGLAVSSIKNLEVTSPSYEIQVKTRQYIDKRTKMFENIIAQKEKMINLLEQQRQSIITETVTKGLNPNVKMKDSGIELIGEIPEHWEVKKVKHFATHVGSGKTPSGGSEVYLDEGIPFLRSLNVHFDGIRSKDLAFISEETNAEMKSSQVKPLDILLNITGASIGRTALVPKDFGRANVNQHVCIIRLNQNKVYPYYFNIIMSSDVINQQIWFAQNGSSREGLNFVQVKELTFSIPPTLEEQREINEWIYNKQKGIFEIIGLVKKQIDNLKEYRQSLIYEAVTGKIDVRDMELD